MYQNVGNLIFDRNVSAMNSFERKLVIFEEIGEEIGETKSISNQW